MLIKNKIDKINYSLPDQLNLLYIPQASLKSKIVINLKRI